MAISMKNKSAMYTKANEKCRERPSALCPGGPVGGRKLGLDGGYKANATVTFLQATNTV